MTMDFLDEETIEVTRTQKKEHLQVTLGDNPVLKNREFDINELAQLNDYNNPLLNASTSLLTSCVTLSRMPQPNDIHQFRHRLIEQIKTLKQHILRLDYPASVSDKCCFLFCITLDEFVLHSPWGEDTSWENSTLVSELFGVRDGGEQFFKITEKSLLQPKLLKDLLELIYIFLRIGFKGQYRQHGREALDQVTHRIEQVVFEHTQITSLSKPELPVITHSKKPRKSIRFFWQLLLFCIAAAFLLIATNYWYQTHYSNRAVDFLSLDTFNEKYWANAQDVETVYTSLDHEMNPNVDPKALKFSHTQEVPATGPSEPSSRMLTIEVASFEFRLSAIQYLRRENLKAFSPQVIYIRSKFRVVIQPQSESRADDIISELEQAGYRNLSYYYHTNAEAQLP